MILDVEFYEDSLEIDVDFGEITQVTECIGGEEYEGDYTVTPKITQQTLPTKEKVMKEDVTIFAIPYFDVTNSSGGQTIYIANEV